MQGELQQVSSVWKAMTENGEDAQKLYDGLSIKGKNLVDGLMDQAKTEKDVANITKQLSTATKGATVAFKLFNAALTTAALWAYSEVIMAIISYESDLVNQLNDATQEYKRQNESIDTYSNRIQELYDKINSGQLTLEENVEANRELRDIQKDLVNNFGTEASGIDFVTTSLEKQADVLKKVNDLKGSAYMQTEFENNFNKQTNSQKVLSTAMTAGSYAGILGGMALSGPIAPILLGYNLYKNGGYIDQASIFGSNIDQMNKKYEQFSKKFKATTDETFNHVIESYDNIRRLNDGNFEIFGNVENVKETIAHLQTDYKDFPGYTEKWADGLQKVWAAADDVVSKYGEAYASQIQLNIASNEQYLVMQENLKAVYEEYEKAKINGDDKAVEAAARKYKDAVKEIREAVPSETYQKAIIDIVPEIADYDYDILQNSIQEILDSGYKDKLLTADVSLAFNPDIREAYGSLKTLYSNISTELKNIGIETFDGFIEQLFSPDNLKRSELRLWLNKQGYLRDASGVKQWNLHENAITPEDINLVEQYRDALSGLDEEGVETSDDLDRAFDELSRKYGENLAKLLTLVFSEKNRLDWSEWLNSEKFVEYLEALKSETQLTAEQIQAILESLGLINKSGVTDSIWNIMKKKGTSEINGQKQTEATLKQYYGSSIQKIVDVLNKEWDDADLDLLTLDEYYQFLETPPNMVPTIEELNKAKDAYKEYKKAVEEASKTSRQAYEAVDSIAKVESAVSSLSDIYWSTVKKAPGASADDLKHWGTASATQLNSIEDAFNYLIKDEDKEKQEKLTAALKEFEATLVHFPNDAQKAEDAINKLVTSYVNESSVLEDLTEENQDYAVARLKAIGIDNAEEVVASRLTKQVKATTTAVKELREEFDKYNNALEQKKDKPEEYAAALKSLAQKTREAMAMRDANGNVLKDENGVEQYFKVTPEFVENHIDTIKKMLAGDQDAFDELQKELEKAEFMTTLSVNLPEEAVDPYFDYLWDLIDKTNLKEIEIGADLDDSAFLASLNAMVGSSWEYADQIARIFKSYGIDLTVARQYSKTGANGMTSEAAKYLDKNGPFTGAKKVGEAGLGDKAKLKPEAPKDSSKGGSAADKEKSEYEKAMEILKELREADLIDEKQYLDQKRKLIEQLWKDGKMKAEEYFKAIHEWLKEMLSYYNQIISDVTKILNKQKEKLEKERNQRIKAIEEERDAQLKAIDEEIKALDKRIKLKQKEIDELQKANEARKQAIDLQKAEYEWQRSIHQRTLLRYEEGADGKGQMVYRNDPEAMKQAKENLEEKQYEKRLSILEKELELLNEEKDKLSEQREQIEEHYQTLLDETNKYYDEAIKRIDEYIEKWESLAEAEENALMEARLASIGLSIDDILSFDEGSFESFKEMYLGILNDIYSNNELMQGSLAGAWGELPSYMQSTADAIKGLNGLDLTSFDNAMDSLNNGMQTFKDLDPESWPTDLDGIATKYGEIGTEAAGAAETAAAAAEEASETAVAATNNVVSSVSDLKNLLDGSGPVETSGKTTKAVKPSQQSSTASPPPGGYDDGGTRNVGGGSVASAFGEVANVSKETSDAMAGDLRYAAKEAENTAVVIQTTLADAIEEIKGPHTIEFNLKVNGSMANGGFSLNDVVKNSGIKGIGKKDGTVGAAFFNGYPGLDSPEENAIRSEFGQPELTVYPNGTYEITTTPTISDLPKGTVIFSEEQTNRILKNSGKKNGKAFAKGTNYLPLQDAMPDKAEIFERFNANLQDNIAKISSSVGEMNSNVRDIAGNITNIANNNTTGNNVTFGSINVTCPGVTEAEVARNIGGALQAELEGMFTGFALKANQRAMRR